MKQPQWNMQKPWLKIIQWITCLTLFPIPAHTNSKFKALNPVQMAKFLTFRTDLANFLHIVLGAIVDGMCDSALADSLVLAGWCRAEHSHILHCLAQLSGSNAHTTWRKMAELINICNFVKKNIFQEMTCDGFCYKDYWQRFKLNSVWLFKETQRPTWNSAEQNSCWRHPRIHNPHVFSMEGKCDLHYCPKQASQ